MLKGGSTFKYIEEQKKKVREKIIIICLCYLLLYNNNNNNTEYENEVTYCIRIFMQQFYGYCVHFKYDF